VAFNHRTIGTDVSTAVVNVSYPLEVVTLTSVGLSLRRQDYGLASLSFRLGLTPPGDQNVEVYEVLLSGLMSPADGLNWTGSIRLREEMFLVLNYISSYPVFMFLTWTTTG
jgi:hypothetical protein